MQVWLNPSCTQEKNQWNSFPAWTGWAKTFHTGEDVGLARVPDATEGVCALYVVPNLNTYSNRTAKVGSRFHNGTPSTTLCTLHNKPIVEFVSFGRSHRYHAEDYGRYSAGWRNNLLTEARALSNSILADQTLARDYHERMTASALGALTSLEPRLISCGPYPDRSSGI